MLGEKCQDTEGHVRCVSSYLKCAEQGGLWRQTADWCYQHVHAPSCPPLFNPRDCSPPGSPVHGVFQARILEWAAISYSRGSGNEE